MVEAGNNPALDHPSEAVGPLEKRRLVGNRMALAGAIIYLLEWVAIIGFGAGTVPSNPGTSAADIVREYSQHATAIAWMAGWFALVLQGRILLIAGIREALRRSFGDSALADLAVGAMVVSVVIEIASYLVAAGVAHAATIGADQSTVLSGDAIANSINFGLWSPLGVSILSISFLMLRSRLFPWWLCWIGMIAGAAGAVFGVTGDAALQAGGGVLFQVGSIATTISALGFWLWMLVTGVILFRAAGHPVNRPISANA